MTDFSVSGPYGMYHAVIIVKDQFLSNACSGAFPIQYTTVVGHPSYAWPNHESDKREQMLELVGSTCTSSNKFAVDRILNVILNWRCPVLAVTH